jgi:hypothetical protein
MMGAARPAARRAAIAQASGGPGVDFSRITTRATVQNGLEYASKRLNYLVDRSQKACPRA